MTVAQGYTRVKTVWENISKMLGGKVSSGQYPALFCTSSICRTHFFWKYLKIITVSFTQEKQLKVC